jgi:hypothetical protein
MSRRARQVRERKELDAASAGRVEGMHKGRCEVSGKVRWASVADARAARTNMASGRGKPYGAEYQCGHCGDWHMTRTARA